MKRPGFFEGVGFALLTTITGGFLFYVFTSFFSAGFVLRLIVAAMALAYLVYLLIRGSEKTGRITVVGVWSLVSCALLVLNVPLTLYLVIHVVMIWLVRSLYYYGGVIPSMMDMALSASSLVVALWASLQTQSIFAGIWCFFLLQALFTAIPYTIQAKRKIMDKTAPQFTGHDRFERAHRAARQAVSRLNAST